MSSLKPKLYVESLAEVAPNVFGPNVAAEKAATRRNRPPLRFNNRTYVQKFGYANAPVATGSIVPEGVERQPGHAWYNVLQPNKKSVTRRFPYGDPRGLMNAHTIMTNPNYRGNVAQTMKYLGQQSPANPGALPNTPWGLRYPNRLAKQEKRALNKAITQASQSPWASPEALPAAIEARRVQGESNLLNAYAAAVAVAEEEAAERSAAAPGGANGGPGGASARKTRSRRNRRRTTRRRR